MVSKSFIVCRLLGGTGRRMWMAAPAAKPPALLCARRLFATATAIARGFAIRVA